MAGISEATSEKRRRGRPRVLSPETEAAFRHFVPDVGTRRGRLNVMWRTHALNLLVEEPDAFVTYRWLLGEDPATPKLRFGVLEELGRWDDPASIIALARETCEAAADGATPAELTARLRRARLENAGLAPVPASPEGLAAAILAVIERYETEHPDCTAALADAALWRVLEVVLIAMKAERNAEAGEPREAET
jgi:hypothetical protein